MTEFVVLFSGGISSWAAARRLVDAHGTSGIVLLFTDTLTEDRDLYRFLYEAAADIAAPLEMVAEGRDIWQVFRDERMLGNARIDPCSRILKREQSRRWIENHAPDAAIVIGYDWDEGHRLEQFAAAWSPRQVIAPLMDKPYLSRTDKLALARSHGLRPPRLYDLGFAHNNCGGGCVKAGIGHFAHLLKVLPDVYATWEANEQRMRDQLGEVSILRDRSGGTTDTLTLRDLRVRIEAGQPIDLWDIGGCDCFGAVA